MRKIKGKGKRKWNGKRKGKEVTCIETLSKNNEEKQGGGSCQREDKRQIIDEKEGRQVGQSPMTRIAKDLPFVTTLTNRHRQTRTYIKH